MILPDCRAESDFRDDDDDDEDDGGDGDDDDDGGDGGFDDDATNPILFFCHFNHIFKNISDSTFLIFELFQKLMMIFLNLKLKMLPQFVS